MRETLKELNAELAVLHESLERAEIIERQLPAYLREIEAERDEATAERDQLRAEVERLRVEMALICRITKGNSADLSKPVDAVAEYVTEVRGRINAATARAEASEKDTAECRAEYRALFKRSGELSDRLIAAESSAAGLRRALEEVDATICLGKFGDIIPVYAESVRTALAASHDEHARRIKSEALREFAKSRDIEVVGNGDWYSGIAAERSATVDDLRDTADRLETLNGQ